MQIDTYLNDLLKAEKEYLDIKEAEIKLFGTFKETENISALIKEMLSY